MMKIPLCQPFSQTLCAETGLMQNIQPNAPGSPSVYPRAGRLQNRQNIQSLLPNIYSSADI